MSTPAKAHEPTMEEILASIRRIITDDDPVGGKPAPAAAAPAKAPEPDAEPEAGLGQDDIDAMFASFDAPAAAAPEPARPEPPKPELVAPKAEAAPPKPELAPLSPPEDLDVFELTEDMAAPVEPEPVKPAPKVEFKPEPAPRSPLPPLSAERLLSAPADDAVSSAFGSLANTILTSNARTLDDIVKEMLRPMLRAWLDDNLPPLVERLVKAEIERVARGGR